MKLVVNMISECNEYGIYTGKRRLAKSWVVEGKTKEECFEKAYPEERHLRYINGKWIEFANPQVQKEYMEWRKTGVTIEMYYGGGTID